MTSKLIVDVKRAILEQRHREEVAKEDLTRATASLKKEQYKEKSLKVTGAHEKWGLWGKLEGLFV